MVSKPCPKCAQHVPVACKACPCGHVFFVARRPISIHKVGSSAEGEVKRRRTERIRREKPNYFNSLQIENEIKRLKSLQKSRQRTENSTSSSANDMEGEGSNSEDGSATNVTPVPSKNKKRGRPKKTLARTDKVETKPVEKEEDLFANISKEKEAQFSIILDEINRKMVGQQFNL